MCPASNLLRRREGIGDYGNCVGIPTVLAKSCSMRRTKESLVNAMASPHARRRAHPRRRRGVGNRSSRGARTGERIHGASFASEDLTEASDAKRPACKSGIPSRRSASGASLELIRSGHIVAIQDMGAPD